MGRGDSVEGMGQDGKRPGIVLLEKMSSQINTRFLPGLNARGERDGWTDRRCNSRINGRELPRVREVETNP